MNHYVKGLIVLLVMSAISISGVYATGSGISLNINGCSNSVSQSVPSGSAINQAISSHSAAITGTAQINGPYFFTDVVTNPEGDNAGITVDVVGITGITTGSHSFTSSIAPMSQHMRLL